MSKAKKRTAGKRKKDDAQLVRQQMDKLLEQAHDIDVIIRAYLRGISQSMNVRRISLMLLDEVENELFIRHAHGLEEQITQKIRVRVGEGISGWVAKTGEPLFVTNIDQNRRFKKEKKTKGFRSSSFISLPLKRAGKVYGVLNVSEKKDARPFTIEELKKLEFFGIQLTILMENERLRREIEWLEKKPIREIAEVSHDFRIPLTCVEEVLQLLDREDLGPITAPQREYLQLAKRNVKRMIGTFDQLINIAMRVTKEPDKLTKFEFGEFLRDVADSFSAKARSRQVRLFCEIPRTQVWMMNDERRVRDVVMNLVDNAVKYTKTGTEVRVRMEERAGERVRLEVKDHGPGIEGKLRETLFDQFEARKRLRTETPLDGHGLGLAISFEIVKALGGEMGFHSKPSEGTTFYIEIPQKKSIPQA